MIQGVGGGIFPLAFGIIRDEFPREKVAGSIGLMSAILGIGAGFGIVAGALVVEHLSYHWLFWGPLAVILVATFATWRYVPESPVRVPGRINWLAAALMSIGMTAVLVAVSETTAWGWGSARAIGLLLAGLVVCGIWVLVETRSTEPLIDMTLMRIRGVWTANLAAFLLGAGMYASFIIFPQFAQLPKSTGFGFGASVVVSGLYLLPSTVGMFLVGFAAGRIARALRLEGGARRRLGDHGARVRRAARAARSPLRHARSARRLLGIGHRPRVRRARQPRHLGRRRRTRPVSRAA